MNEDAFHVGYFDLLHSALWKNNDQAESISASSSIAIHLIRGVDKQKTVGPEASDWPRSCPGPATFPFSKEADCIKIPLMSSAGALIDTPIAGSGQKHADCERLRQTLLNEVAQHEWQRGELSKVEFASK